MYRKIFMCCMICILFLGLSTECGKREPVVALIGMHEIITLREFKTDYSMGKLKKTLPSSKLSELKKHLDEMINRRIKVLSSYELRLDEDSTVVDRIKPILIQQLINRLYQTEIVDPIVKESNIREFYIRTGKSVVVRNVLFKLSPKAEPEKDDSVRTKAEEVLDRIRAGEDFVSLASKFSEDESSAKGGGMLGELSWTKTNDPILKTIFSLEVGGISELVKNDKGYNILRVEEIRDKERKPYKQAREEIKQILIRENQTLFSKKAQEYWNEVMRENHLQWCMEELALLTERLKLFPNPLREVLLDSLENLNESEKSVVLVRIKGGDFTIRDFLKRIETFPKRRRINVVRSEILKSMIEQWLIGELLSEKAIQKGLDKDRDVINGVKKTLEQEMINLLIQREVVGQIDPSEEELREYYEVNKEEKYSVPEKVKVQEVLVKDKKLADKVARMARIGGDLGRLAQEYTERPRYKEKKGIMDYFVRGRWGAVGEKAFNIEIGEITGPIKLENNQGYSVIKLLEKKSPEVSPFDKVRYRVDSDYANDSKKEREEAWITAKRRTYRVRICDEVLENAFLES